MSSNEYRTWTELIEEVKSYYNNYDELFENIKNNECAVFCSMISEIEQCLIFCLEWKNIIFRLHNYHEFEDKIAQYYEQWNPFYFVIGHTLEGIFKFIFIRDDLEHYFENIKNKDKNKSLLRFDLAKNRIIELLHEKNINEKKIDR